MVELRTKEDQVLSQEIAQPVAKADAAIENLCESGIAFAAFRFAFGFTLAYVVTATDTLIEAPVVAGFRLRSLRHLPGASFHPPLATDY
jgi:hypothetical protein